VPDALPSQARIDHHTPDRQVVELHAGIQHTQVGEQRTTARVTPEQMPGVAIGAIRVEIRPLLEDEHLRAQRQHVVYTVDTQVLEAAPAPCQRHFR
jgi:hypothetical protein